MVAFGDYAQRCPHCAAVNAWDAKWCGGCKNIIKVPTVYPAPPWVKELFETIDAEFRERRSNNDI